LHDSMLRVRDCVSSSFCYSDCDHRSLHSFPTRRSSDLIGDSYMVAGGLIEQTADHLAAMATMALAMHENVRKLNTKFGDLNLRTDRKSTRLNSSHVEISYAVFCLKKKKEKNRPKSTESG